MANSNTKFRKLLIWLTLTVSTSCSEATTAPAKSELSTVKTTICELVSRPKAFSGKTVVVKAELLHDGLHGGVLTDPTCDRVGVPAYGPLRDPDVGPLAAAMRQGCLGTIDKIITATWTGRFHSTAEIEGTMKLPRGLEITAVDDLLVRPRPNSPTCENR